MTCKVQAARGGRMNVQKILDQKGSNVFAVRPDASLREITAMMAGRRIGTVLVTDRDGRLAGIVSERDIVRILADPGTGVGTLTAGDLMTRSVICCSPESSIHEILEMMQTHRVRHLPVLCGREVRGLVSIRDVLQFRMESLEANVVALRRAEHEVVRAKEAAELADRTKTEFLANVSHELKTPLNAIIGFAEVLTKTPAAALGTPECRGYANEIERAGRHLLEVVEDILDIARIQTGELRPVAHAFTVTTVVDSCERLIAERAQRAGVRLTIEPSVDLPMLTADRRMLKQMLVNLLSNAVKFTPKGGEVAIQCAADADGTIRISVADTGIGISPENLATVKLPFRQVESSQSRKYEGTGLGLALVDAMMRLHGGTLDLESAPGAGTTATLCFPPQHPATLGHECDARTEQPQKDVA